MLQNPDIDAYVERLFGDLQSDPEKVEAVRAAVAGYQEGGPLHKLGIQVLNAAYGAGIPPTGVLNYYRYLDQVTEPLGFCIGTRGNPGDLQFLNGVAKRAQTL